MARATKAALGATRPDTGPAPLPSSRRSAEIEPALTTSGASGVLTGFGAPHGGPNGISWRGSLVLVGEQDRFGGVLAFGSAAEQVAQSLGQSGPPIAGVPQFLRLGGSVAGVCVVVQVALAGHRGVTGDRDVAGCLGVVSLSIQ
jgi:hypothetical protein